MDRKFTSFLCQSLKSVDRAKINICPAFSEAGMIETAGGNYLDKSVVNAFTRAQAHMKALR